MKIRKKVLITCYLLGLTILNNCIQNSSALFGPAFTVAKTGNVYQGGISYVSNTVIKDQLGKNPIEYVKEIFIQEPDKIEKNLLIDSNKIINNTKVSLNYTNNENDYINFINAVKKNLK